MTAGPGVRPSPSSEVVRPEETFRPPRFADSTLIAILILCAVLPYLNALVNGFVYDDHNEVLNNPYIKNFGHLKEIFTTNILAHLGARGVTNYYRPMSTFGFLWCYQIFGPLAYGFHLANIVLNTLVVCLLFRVTERMFSDRNLAFGAAALFALHPIHTEAVAWISAVTDLELTLFYLLTFWFFLGVARPGGGRSGLAQLGMTGSFILTALSKEAAVTLPVLATLYEHVYRDDRQETTWLQKLGRYGLLWLLTITYLLFRFRFFGALAPVTLTPKVSWHEAFLSAFALLGQYLGKLVWPASLSAYYTFHKSSVLTDPQVLAGIAGAVLCAAVIVTLRKRAQPASFGLVWLLLTLAPVLNARWLGPNVLTERYLYLPSAGFCWLAAWGGLKLWAQAARRSAAMRNAFLAALGLLAILGAARIVWRNRDWRDDVTYYQRALAAEPDAASLRLNLGAVYWGQGKSQAAEREWREVLKLAPDNALVLNNLGLVLAAQKRYGEARDYFHKSMRLRPNFADPHLNLGRLEAEMGMTEAAELQLRAAVALAPFSIPARNSLGEFYFTKGELSEAEEQFCHSVESGANLGGYDRLGDIYMRWGRLDEAAQAFKRAIAVDEFDSHAHFGLGAVREAQGRSEEALREYEAGLQTDPRNSEALAAVERLKQKTDQHHAPNN